MAIVGVKFDNCNSIEYFFTGNLKLKKNITVIVQTDRGLDFGVVDTDPFESKEKKYLKLCNVVRVASHDDFNKYRKNLKDAKAAFSTCKKIVNDMNIHMTIVDCKYTFDRSQLLFRFLSDSRIDFRELARELASLYKTRIELRQIGARDKAREIGGCGQCGRSLCCSSFLRDLDTVSINMAKNQGIALNPSKINGVCGRLMCCLKYEDSCYSDCKKRLPGLNSIVTTDSGKGKVVSVDILNGKYCVDVPNVGIVEVNCGSN